MQTQTPNPSEADPGEPMPVWVAFLPTEATTPEQVEQARADAREMLKQAGYTIEGRALLPELEIIEVVDDKAREILRLFDAREKMIYEGLEPYMDRALRAKIYQTFVGERDEGEFKVGPFADPPPFLGHQAIVCLVRPGREDYEVLLLRREA